MFERCDLALWITAKRSSLEGRDHRFWNSPNYLNQFKSKIGGQSVHCCPQGKVLELRQIKFKCIPRKTCGN